MLFLKNILLYIKYEIAYPIQGLVFYCFFWTFFDRSKTEDEASHLLAEDILSFLLKAEDRVPEILQLEDNVADILLYCYIENMLVDLTFDLKFVSAVRKRVCLKAIRILKRKVKWKMPRHNIDWKSLEDQYES